MLQFIEEPFLSLKQSKYKFLHLSISDCKLDIVFIIERYGLRYLKRFFAGLMDDIQVSSDGIRVGFVIYDSVGTKIFGLTDYTTSEGVRGAIEAIPTAGSSYHYLDKGLQEAQDNVFTAAGGDRPDASNYYVFQIGPFYRNTDAVARDIRSSGNNFIFGVRESYFLVDKNVRNSWI